MGGVRVDRVAQASCLCLILNTPEEAADLTPSSRRRGTVESQAERAFKNQHRRPVVMGIAPRSLNDAWPVLMSIVKQARSLFYHLRIGCRL